MKESYRVIVIGGGIVGASVLYHLTLRGWTDVALIERTELTAGASWHAAGGFHAINFAARFPECVRHLIAVAPAGLTPMLDPLDGFGWGLFFAYAPPQRIARTLRAGAADGITAARRAIAVLGDRQLRIDPRGVGAGEVVDGHVSRRSLRERARPPGPSAVRRRACSR